MKKLIIILMAAVGALATTYAEPFIPSSFCSPSSTATDSSDTYVCKRCYGSGFEPSLTKACPYCNRGRVQHLRGCEVCRGQGYYIDKYGDKQDCSNCYDKRRIPVDETCAYCNGTGSVRMECMSCHGSGTVEK